MAERVLQEAGKDAKQSGGFLGYEDSCLLRTLVLTQMDSHLTGWLQNWEDFGSVGAEKPVKHSASIRHCPFVVSKLHLFRSFALCLRK